MLLLKNKIKRISLWLIMSLWSEKQSEDSLMLTLMTILEKSFTNLEALAKVSQLRWLVTPTKDSFLQLLELGMDWIVDQDGSWIKIILKLELTLKTVFIMRLFFWMFCEKIFKLFKIIFCYYSQLNKLRSFSLPKVWYISWYAIPC